MKGNSLIKIGRPTKYTKRIPVRARSYTNKCVKGNEFPTIEGLALYLGVGTRTIYTWEKGYSDFLQTTEYLRDNQKHLLITNGLDNKYNTRFASFLLKSIHGYSDTRPELVATQNNYLNVSPDLLADAMKLIDEKDKNE
ncbi:terminase small subunit [Patescibacteria group bacterium]